MSQRVVDILEAVEIEAKNGNAFMSTRGDQCTGGQVMKLGPIGEPCERIVVGHESDLRFVAFALRHVSARAAIALESASCKGWVAVDLQPNLTSVRLADRNLESTKRLPARKALQVADPELARERVDPERFRELEADVVGRQSEIGIGACDRQPVVGFPGDVRGRIEKVAQALELAPQPVVLMLQECKLLTGPSVCCVANTRSDQPIAHALEPLRNHHADVADLRIVHVHGPHSEGRA